MFCRNPGQATWDKLRVKVLSEMTVRPTVDVWVWDSGEKSGLERSILELVLTLELKL